MRNRHFFPTWKAALRHKSRLATVLAVAVGATIVSLGAALAASSPVVVWQTAPGTTLKLYVVATKSVIDLPGTAKMKNAIIGDVDGNGLENEIVYTDANKGGIGYYKIPSDGLWHAENDHYVSYTNTDAIPLAVVRTGGVGTVGTIVYKSPSAGTSYRIKVGTSTRYSMGKIDKAYAADLRSLGYKSDLIYWASGSTLKWREGLTGTIHTAPFGDWVPLGSGKVLSGYPACTIAFLPVYAAVPTVYVCDRNFNYVKIDGLNWPWCTTLGSLSIGDTDGQGLSSVVFSTGTAQPMQFYRAPSTGTPFDANAIYTVPGLACGWNIHGVGLADVGASTPPPPSTPVQVSTIGSLATIANGTNVQIVGKARTKLVNELSSTGSVTQTGYYIEETDKSAGIRVVGATTLSEGQLVTVTGVLSDLNGERVINASAQSALTTTMIIPPLSSTIKSLFGTVAMTGLLVQVSGTITSANLAGGSLVLSDGTQTIKAYCSNNTYTSGQYTVTGCVGAEKSSTGASTPVLRIESASGIVPVVAPTPTPTPATNYSCWTTSSLVKVQKTDAVQTLQAASIKAARNEHEAFQIVMRPKSAAVNSVALGARDLVSANGTIPSANVSIYVPAWIPLPTQSRYIADPLPPYRGPFNIAYGDTQPIWIDVYVPKGTPAGDYTSSVVITDASGATTIVPYSLHVYNFTLPDDWKSRATMGQRLINIADKHGVTLGTAEATALIKKYYEMALQHGVSVFYHNDNQALPVSLTSTDAQAYLADPRMSVVMIPYTEDAATLKNYISHIKAVPGAWDKAMMYTYDEPRTTAQMAEVRRRCTLFHSIDPTIKCQVPFGVADDGTDLFSYFQGYVDIWTPVTSALGNLSNAQSNVTSKVNSGQQVWSYFCLGVPRDQFMQFNLDNASVEFREILWQNYSWKISGFLYWDMIFWETVADPWVSMQNEPSYPDVYAEGSLLYPGKKVGIDGPVSSIRLELFRDGMEDYQYFWLLEQKLGRSAVLPYIQKVTQDWKTFTRDPVLFQSVRDQIAQQIEP